jgi:hypothetical protein
MSAFKFYHDPGHGWLKVTAKDLVRVGMTRHDFSGCSYRSVAGTTYYLEEDSDATLFETRWTEVFGTKPEIVCLYRSRSAIRYLPSIHCP